MDARGRPLGASTPLAGLHGNCMCIHVSYGPLQIILDHDGLLIIGLVCTHRLSRGLSPDFSPDSHRTFYEVFLGFDTEFRVWRLKKRAEALLLGSRLLLRHFSRSELQPWISFRDRFRIYKK